MRRKNEDHDEISGAFYNGSGRTQLLQVKTHVGLDFKIEVEPSHLKVCVKCGVEDLRFVTRKKESGGGVMMM